MLTNVRTLLIWANLLEAGKLEDIGKVIPIKPDFLGVVSSTWSNRARSALTNENEEDERKGLRVPLK